MITKKLSLNVHETSETKNLTHYSKIRLTVSYSGEDFVGWQKQPQGKTIQGELEKVLFILFKEPIKTQASGRTDAHTHAVGQVVHFSIPLEYSRWGYLQKALNALLPSSIRIREVFFAPQEFHALHSCETKLYRYLIWNEIYESPFLKNRALWYHYPLCIDSLNHLTQPFIGTHDFKLFQNKGTDVKHTIRTLYSARWERTRSGVIRFSIQGNGFLKQMVRNIVGFILFSHRHKWSPEEVLHFIQKGSELEGRKTVPAHGLYLVKVYYPKKIDSLCQKITPL